MVSPNRDAFLGLKQLPSCTELPQVVLQTVGFKCCILCAQRYMESLFPLVDVFYVNDGAINDKATSYGIRRHEIAPAPANPTLNQSGG